MEEEDKLQADDWLKPDLSDISSQSSIKAKNREFCNKIQIWFDKTQKSDLDNSKTSVTELEGINDLFNLLNLEMDREVNCFFYKGKKYKLNLPYRNTNDGKSWFRPFDSSVPKSIGKRMTDEDREMDIKQSSLRGRSIMEK